MASKSCCSLFLLSSQQVNGLSNGSKLQQNKCSNKCNFPPFSKLWQINRSTNRPTDVHLGKKRKLNLQKSQNISPMKGVSQILQTRMLLVATSTPRINMSKMYCADNFRSLTAISSKIYHSKS